MAIKIPSKQIQSECQSPINVWTKEQNTIISMTTMATKLSYNNLTEKKT